ncbi:Uncharacterized protein YwqG [Chitinophaga sp. CF118]|uniref:DUF1963 domain-containing protein n=1 Tax=Chitinophaga sp. CF118 TaxID=1884367 RepID=UPI0008EC4F22|nr:DUF1963 domain-containing protein [Chitinophaga sp. CF118]SFE61152.1 Uncharacterized protein YwqG [Chitinophaga sp. CF118]
MQSASAKTFSVNFPSIYEHILTVREHVMGEHRKGDECLSYVSISLQELSSYDEYKGDDLLARFQESCLEERGAVEVIADKTLQVAGLRSDIRTAGSPKGDFYYFGLLPVSSEYGYVFIGDCKSDSREFYEPLFDEILQSLQYLGDLAETLQEGEEAFKSLIDDAIEDNRNITPFSVPADGQECWQIGSHMFVLSGERLCYISDGGGDLYVKIEAQAPEYIDLEQSDIINDYNDRKVYLQFCFKGIYHSGIPTGKFRIEKSKDSSYLSSFWKDGFHYLQDLTAEVSLEAGWLGINGFFNQYPVKVAVKLPIENLVWERYSFLSEQEVSTAAPDIVRRLLLTDPYPGTLEETIRSLTQLEVLSIYFRDSQRAADFKAVPKAVKGLKELRKLSLTGVSALDSLPQWLGDLKKLETIHLSGSKVEGIHPYILQLPVVKELYLSGNQLQSIHPALPEKLETLVLANNRLTSVPGSVTRLQYLDIEKNPLQQLPAELEKIPRLKLELEKKMALLDYTYKGADGQGMVPYDDRRFFAKYDPELLQTLETQINAARLEKFKEGLINCSRKSVALETTEQDTYLEKGNHRFGGLPDLPPGLNYPSFIVGNEQVRGFQFIAQINCAAIAHLQEYLPRTGILYFFVNDLEQMEPKVLYYDGDSSDLQSAKDLDIETAFTYDDDDIYTPFRVASGKYPNIPTMYNAVSLYPELTDLEEMSDEAEQLKNGLEACSVSPVHSMNSYVFKQHGTPEMEAVNEKKGNPEDWMVLLRVSSDDNPGFCFWDAGELYFVIHKSDLEKKDFSNVYCGLESS